MVRDALATSIGLQTWAKFNHILKTDINFQLSTFNHKVWILPHPFAHCALLVPRWGVGG
jgi:hypothetical protein